MESNNPDNNVNAGIVSEGRMFIGFMDPIIQGTIQLALVSGHT